MATETVTRTSRSRTSMANTTNTKAALTKDAPTKPVNGKRQAATENEPPAKKAKRVNGAKAENAKAKQVDKPKEKDEKVEEDDKKTDEAKKAVKAPAKRKGRPAAKDRPTRAAGTKVKRAVENKIPTIPEHIRPANQLFVWGAGNFGQFGLGPDQLGEYDKPKKNVWIEKKMETDIFGEDNAGLEAVAAGGLHTMFIDEKGTVWTCGVNDDAALGRITKDVPDPDNEGQFLDIDELTATPYPLQTLVDENFRAVSIVAGDSISAAVSDKGELRVWGSFRANEGSLGFSNGSKYQHLPAPILHLPSKPGDEELVSSVAAGNNHLVVLTTHGNIYTWGAGEQGQLGRKILERRKIHGTNPEKVTLSTRSRKAVVVGAGNYASFAVDNEGDVWGWGLNNCGQTGTGFDRMEDDATVEQPLFIPDLSPSNLDGDNVVSISGGEHHTLFLTKRGRVYACGRSQQGQLGLPDGHKALLETKHEGMVVEPTLVPFPEDDPVVHISAGIHNNLAVTSAGALYAWGTGNQGELGVGDDVEARTPTMIVRKEGGSWKAITASCGGQHSLGMFRKKA